MKIPFSLGDSRINSRAQKCIEKIANNPSASLPEIFENPSELTAFYRLVNNEDLDWNDIVDGICKNTMDLCDEQTEIIAIHDSSQFEPTPKKQKVKGFGKISNKISSVFLDTLA